MELKILQSASKLERAKCKTRNIIKDAFKKIKLSLKEDNVQPPPVKKNPTKQQMAPYSNVPKIQ